MIPVVPLSDSYHCHLMTEGVLVDQQQFQNEVMHDLGAETPPSSADESFEEGNAAEGEGYQEEDALEDASLEEMDLFEEGGEESFGSEGGFTDGFEEDLGAEFAAEAGDSPQSLEDTMAEALDAGNSDEFLRLLLQGVSRAAGSAQRGATRVSQAARRTGEAVTQGAARASVAAGRAGRLAEQASQAQSPWRFLLQRLRQYRGQGFDEFDALEDMADWLADENLDEALPVFASMVARSVVRPVLRRSGARLSPPLRQQLLRSTVQAAQTLSQNQGPQALRVLPRIARSVAQTAARHRLNPATLPQAIRRTTAQVATRPELLRRLLQPATPVKTQGRPAVMSGRRVRRFIIRGPVEIMIVSR
jgi:hypothetical protein